MGALGHSFTDLLFGDDDYAPELHGEWSGTGGSRRCDDQFADLSDRRARHHQFRVSAANTLQLEFMNPANVVITPSPNVVYTLLVSRPENLSSSNLSSLTQIT
jgi:hypothetical protein